MSVEVLWTARYDYQADWRLATHKHDYFQMMYFASGSGCFTLGDREYSIAPGALVLVKPGCPHALSPSSLVKTLDIKFQVKECRLRRLLLASNDQIDDSDPRITNLFERIRYEGDHREHLYRELCSVLLEELLLLFLRKDQTQEVESAQSEPTRHELSSDWIVEQAAQFIREHYAEDCNLLQIARVVGRSDKLVRQHFKDVLGMSPRRYLLQYRIQKAQEEIERSSYSFKEIADRVGFKTIHHFTRSFHETCGETPGGWRKKYQAGICKDVNINPRFVNTNWIVEKKRTRNDVVLF